MVTSRLLIVIQIVNALMNEIEVPAHVVEWTQSLEYDPLQTPGDRLALLSARTASLRVINKSGIKADNELIELCDALEKDLMAWSESTLAAGSVCSFHNIRDPDSTHAWNGTRHEYGMPQAYRHWNMWRCLRIVLSRLHEAIWRRSWPTLSLDTQPTLDSEHFRALRVRMASDICIAAAYAFGNDSTADPPKGSVSSGYLLVMPLFLAGTCLLEQLREPLSSPGGTRMIQVSEPVHLDILDQSSTQLAWIIERLDYIANKVGIGWANHMSSFLTGKCKLYFDLGRS